MQKKSITLFFCYFPCLSCAHENRYKILCANKVKDNMDPQKAAEIILDAANVPTEQYRMGRSKVQDTFDSAIAIFRF